MVTKFFFSDESDTESLPDSDRGDGDVVEEAIPMEARPRILNIGLEALDGVDSSEEFHQRPHTMTSVPFTMRGAYRGAMQGALDEIIEGRQRRNVVKEERGWKLFFLIPVVAFQASARRWCLQKPVGRPVASFCIRRVVVPLKAESCPKPLKMHRQEKEKRSAH